MFITIYSFKSKAIYGQTDSNKFKLVVKLSMTTFMTISDTNISNDNNCDCISFNALNYLRQNNPQTVGNSDQNMTKFGRFSG